MADLTRIGLRNNLLVDNRMIEITTKVISRLTELHLIDQKYKFDNQWLNLVCEMLELLVSSKDRVNKREVCLNILNSLFGLTPEETAIIEKNIDFLKQNNMIKKVSQYRLFKTGIFELFKKKR